MYTVGHGVLYDMWPGVREIKPAILGDITGSTIQVPYQKFKSLYLGFHFKPVNGIYYSARFLKLDKVTWIMR